MCVTQEYDPLKTYAHRAGRAGRAGAGGVVITFDHCRAQEVVESVLVAERGQGLDTWDLQWEGPRAAWVSTVVRGVLWHSLRLTTHRGAPPCP